MRRAGLSERVARVLLLEEPGHEAFVTRFQQTTGAVMAKGVEDTAFYRYNRLVSLNEVGGIRAGSRARSRSSTPRAWSAPSASRSGSWPPRRTTPSAAPTCGPGSGC